MGGPNLEVFKFGMYIMFPIGIMYYFGTNLDSRFAVPDFWPKEGQTHTIPFEKEDIDAELKRLKERRLAARARRMELESQGVDAHIRARQGEQKQLPKSEILEATKLLDAEKSQASSQKGWTAWFR